jgi:hypothetical protein
MVELHVSICPRRLHGEQKSGAGQNFAGATFLPSLALSSPSHYMHYYFTPTDTPVFKKSKSSSPASTHAASAVLTLLRTSRSYIAASREFRLTHCRRRRRHKLKPTEIRIQQLRLRYTCPSTSSNHPGGQRKALGWESHASVIASETTPRRPLLVPQIRPVDMELPSSMGQALRIISTTGCVAHYQHRRLSRTVIAPRRRSRGSISCKAMAFACESSRDFSLAD